MGIALPGTIPAIAVMGMIFRTLTWNTVPSSARASSSKSSCGFSLTYMPVCWVERINPTVCTVQELLLTCPFVSLRITDRIGSANARMKITGIIQFKFDSSQSKKAPIKNASSIRYNNSV